jgi:hypothetical protein
LIQLSKIDAESICCLHLLEFVPLTAEVTLCKVHTLSINVLGSDMKNSLVDQLGLISIRADQNIDPNYGIKPKTKELEVSSFFRSLSVLL